MASGICYIMTNRPRGVLYVGVTTDIGRRTYQHRMGLFEGFSSRYGLIRLVHDEEFPLFMDAVQREKHQALAASVENRADREEQS